MARQGYSRDIGKSFAFSIAIIAVLLYAVASYKLPDWSWTQQLLSKPARLAPRVKLANGTYEGIHSDGYKQDYFLGVPYAKVPERFTVAKSLEDTWDGARNAKAYPRHCVGYGDDHIGYEASEDCLYLNIVRPAGIDVGADLPVAVWIHGGGLAMGGSADSRYNLSFIVHQSVVMGSPMIGVSLNYRLSAFGFLNGKQALDAGVTNIGFRDQRLALRWIQENIVAFGGSASKVTLWGESSGAESVTAQMFAYNGRDDGLFRAAIGQSGFGGMLGRLPEGFNATSKTQKIYDQLVSSTSCAHLVGSDQSIDCLRAAPFDEINHALSKDGLGPWPPALDGDFFQGFITNQLESGNFVQAPLLIGTNSDEGTGFGMGRGPNGGGVNTDDEFAAMLSQFLENDKHEGKNKEMVSELMRHYPNDQSVGIPSLETWPHVIQPGDPYALQLGAQFRRVSAIIGDYTMHYLRRRANLAWKAHGLPSYAYRFDVVPNGMKDFIGSVHFQEVAFVFMNFDGNGYAANPFGGDDERYIAKAKAVSTAMGSAWINFVTSLDPNGDGEELEYGVAWPKYGASKDIGQNVVWDLKGSPAESDDWRAEGIEWFIRHALSVFGS